jgi:ABC-type uncharacterized transport system substrate-binding protein
VPPFRLTALCALALAILPGGRAAEAHPHVMVETETQLVFDNGRLTGLAHSWTFDEMYSTFATQGLDKDRDGTFSREELAELTQVNVEHLGQQKFFTVLRHERRFVSFGGVRDAWSEVVGGKLRLHFTVPVATPFAAGGKPVTLQVYDPDYFVAFSPADGEPMRLVAAPQGCKLDFTPPKTGNAAIGSLSESFFQALNTNANFGQQFAATFTVTCP